MSPAQRLVSLLLHLQARGRLSTAEAATLLAVDRRTALRDLKHLAEVAPMQHVGEGRDQTWILDPFPGQAHLPFLDAIAIRAGRDALGFLDGTALAEGLERAAERVQAAPERLARNFDRKFRFKSQPARRYDDKQEIIDTLLDALLGERCLTIRYDGLKGERDFPGVRPLTLVVHRRAVYLLVQTRPDRRPFRLAVDRILAAEAAEPFTYPAEWDPDAELASSWGITAADRIERVILDFGPKVRRYVEDRSWHPSARLLPLANGGLRLTMETGGREMVSFVLEWGEHCQVVEPAWLRDRVVESLRAALRRYSAAELTSARRPPAVAAAMPVDTVPIAQGE